MHTDGPDGPLSPTFTPLRPPRFSLNPVSRERVFGALLLASVVLGPLLGYALASAEGEQRPVLRTNDAPATTAPQARSNPDPIFQCTGAGVGVVVSLGGDGKSIYVFCSDVKS